MQPQGRPQRHRKEALQQQVTVSANCNSDLCNIEAGKVGIRMRVVISLATANGNKTVYCKCIFWRTKTRRVNELVR